MQSRGFTGIASHQPNPDALEAAEMLLRHDEGKELYEWTKDLERSLFLDGPEVVDALTF
jgi:hypothetical protein